jgi:hypothetical protein
MKGTKELDQALFEAQGTVEPVFKTVTARGVDDDVWSYATFEDVQAAANRRFANTTSC